MLTNYLYLLHILNFVDMSINLWHIIRDVFIGAAMELKGKIKELFAKKHRNELVETSRRIPIPDGFVDNYTTVFAAELRNGEKKCGARLYCYEDCGVSLKKKVIEDMPEDKWQRFRLKLDNGRKEGFIENNKVDIPSSLCEGQHGVYAMTVKKYENGMFINGGVNIYKIDEKLRAVKIRSMSVNTWARFSSLMSEAKKQEEELRRAQLMKLTKTQK